MKKKNQLKSCCKNSLSSREVVARDLPHPKMLSLLNRKQQPYFMREAEDPGTLRAAKLSGMTPNFMGFTLIELLVVVLIIGILAAVALPQYKFAVAKTRLVQLVTAAKSIKQAEEAYYLANGEYTIDWTVLDTDFTGTWNADSRTFVANSGWNAELGIAKGWVALYDTHISGVRLYYFWDHASDSPGKRKCYAKQTDASANKLCKVITQTTTGRSDGTWYSYTW